MPTPGKKETQKEFVSRCIPMVMDEGTAKDQKQAAAICFQMWRDRNKKKEETAPQGEDTAQKAADGAGEEAEVKMMHGGEMEMPAHYGGATTFADLHAAEQAEKYAHHVGKLSDQFGMLAANILAGDVEDKAAALAALADEFTSLVQAPPDEEMHTMETTAPPAVQDGGSWFDALLARVKEALGLTKPQPPASPGVPPPGAGFMVWKEADGTYRWLARYSNNRRDQDNPPEIISDKSHRRFDEMLSKGEAPMPELWLWHVPEWKWGQTTWHAYDDAGFPMAAGVVDRGKETIAEHLMALDPALVRVSHGMPTKSIVRDPQDESVIVEHVTREISPLPAWAAANQLTGFTILKEATDMAIPQDKRDALKTEWNLTDELLSKLEAANVEQAKEADEAGIEKKEVVTAETTVAPTEPEVTQEAPTEAPLTRAEMQAVLQQIGAAIAGLTEQVKALSSTVVEVKEQKAVEEAETLSELFQRAIGNPAARVDGRTSEAKDRPAETKPPVPEIVNSGHPLADHVINSLVSGKWLESFNQEQNQ